MTAGLSVTTGVTSPFPLATESTRIRQQLCDGAPAGTALISSTYVRGVIGALMFATGALPTDVTSDVVFDTAAETAHLATIDSTGKKVWLTYY